MKCDTMKIKRELPGGVILEMSEQGKRMLALQEKLAQEYHYKPIEPNLFLGDVRDAYRENLPEWCKERGDPHALLYTLGGTLISHGYRRIVIGDYGAFVEIDANQMLQNVICCKPGQEYRYRDERFAKHIKYQWLTVPDGSDPKIYYQVKPVDYADYVPGRYYVSPYEVTPIERNTPEK